MDEIIFRSLRKEATRAEEEALASWRKASPQNEAYYQNLIEALRLSDRHDPRAEALSPPSAAEIIRHAEPQVPAAVRPSRQPTKPGSRGPYPAWSLPAVAAAAVLLIVFTLLQLQPDRDSHSQIALGGEEFVTGVSETATVRLRDGTVVRLAPASRLQLTSTRNTREVVLQGRAFFAVAPMKHMPFVVRTTAGIAQVLGTQFELNVQGSDLRLIVVEGRVALAERGRVVEVDAGEMARVVDGTVSSSTAAGEAISELAWVGKILVFRDMPLRDAVAQLEQVYGVPIELAPGAPVNHTISGWFVDRSFEEVLKVVCEVVAAECTVADSSATVGR